LHVALLTTSWPRDDADASGRFLANQVERLRASGVRVDVVGPRSAVGARTGFRDAGLASGGGVVRNAMRRPWLVPVMLVSMVLTLRRVARSADIVHANWLLTAPIAALAGKPLLLTLHGSGTAGSFSDLALAQHRPRWFRWLVRRAAVVAAVSAPLADAARAAGAHHVERIPHGVDVADQPRTEPDELTMLFAGRLSHEKGLDVLVEAIAAAPAGSTLASAKLIVVGDGPERTRLEPLGIEPLGFVPQEQLVQLYDRASLLVMPSRSEGFGVVALDAMARGVPVVASDVGGLGKLVEHERTGLLVPANEPGALRMALERLLCDAQLRAEFGRNAYDVARTGYGWGQVTQALTTAYEKACKTSILG
jgi:glycosyltransferase involved in cell wall biosynthesis